MVRQYFDYHVDGYLVWKVKVAQCVQIGQRAGSKHATGYIHITLLGGYYKAHRLIYAFHHGRIKDQIDHINRIKDDNRIENLRDVTGSVNTMNTAPLRSTNTSGVKGVSFCKDQINKKWAAYFQREGRKIQKYFHTKEEAVNFRDENIDKIYGKL